MQQLHSDRTKDMDGLVKPQMNAVKKFFITLLMLYMFSSSFYAVKLITSIKSAKYFEYSIISMYNYPQNHV